MGNTVRKYDDVLSNSRLKFFHVKLTVVVFSFPIFKFLFYVENNTGGKLQNLAHEFNVCDKEK